MEDNKKDIDKISHKDKQAQRAKNTAKKKYYFSNLTICLKTIKEKLSYGGIEQ